MFESSNIFFIDYILNISYIQKVNWLVTSNILTKYEEIEE